jgi:hypothetical protein
VAVDVTYVVWPHGPERLQNCLSQVNNLRTSIQLQPESILLWSGHYEREDTGNQNLLESFKSNRSPHLKTCLLRNLHDRACTMRRERQDLFTEISSLKHDLQLNAYPRFRWLGY